MAIVNTALENVPVVVTRKYRRTSQLTVTRSVVGAATAAIDENAFNVPHELLLAESWIVIVTVPDDKLEH